MTAKVFEVALGIAAPWSVTAVEFDDVGYLSIWHFCSFN